jgi:hypothetical protein
MPRYSVTGTVHGLTWLGKYVANTPEEAFELAYNGARIKLCLECARSVSDPEVCELTAEDVDTGVTTSEATTNDQIVEQAAEIKRLRSAIDAAELGCEIAYRREPTQAEGDAHELPLVEGEIGRCHVPMGNHHGSRCHCGIWVWRGATVCQRCAYAEAVKAALLRADTATKVAAEWEKLCNERNRL